MANKEIQAVVQLDQIVRLPNIDELRSFTFRLSKEVESIKILESLSLDRETINIDCFSAREPPSNNPFDVDPDLNKLVHGEKTVGADQWNVTCCVSGVAYRWVLVDVQNNQKIYEPATYLSILVEWYHKDNAFNTGYYKQTTQTDEKGIFNFDFLYPGTDGKNNGWMLNGSDVTLTFMWPLGPEAVTQTLKTSDDKGDHYYDSWTSDDKGDHYYDSWTWEYNAGHEDKHIADKYHSDRDLSCQWEKRFVIEPGQDLGLGQKDNLPSVDEVDWGQVNGNRFVLPYEASFPEVRLVGFHGAGIWFSSRPLKLPCVWDCFNTGAAVETGRAHQQYHSG